MQNLIECPHCHEMVDIEDAIMHKMEENYSKKLEKQRAEDKVQFEKNLQLALKNREVGIREEMQNNFNSKVEELKENNSKLEKELTDVTRNVKEEAWSTFQEEKKTLLGIIESEKSLRESAVKNAEKERKELEELVKKAKQETENRYLSQREQGESFEQSALKTIKELFPEDLIEEVKVGVKGTDLILHVSDNSQVVGSISIECKNPSKKNSWTTWVKKTRMDMSAEGSKLALIVSTIPFDQGIVTDNGQIFGVHSSEAVGVLKLLRKAVIEIARARSQAENTSEKAEVLMDFFGSSKWDNMLLEAFKSLSEISSKVNTIKNAADHIHKNGELIFENFVSQLKSQIEMTILQNGMKVA